MAIKREVVSVKDGNNNAELPLHPRSVTPAEETIVVGLVKPDRMTSINGGQEELHLIAELIDNEVKFALSTFIRNSRWDNKLYHGYKKGSRKLIDRQTAESLIKNLQQLFKEADEIQ